jgi:hypothetical protein
MHKEIACDAILKTQGDGLWSSAQKEVKCTKLVVPYVNEEKTFGELRVYFTPQSWDVQEDGLIYTDGIYKKNGWLQELRYHLRELGFSQPAVWDVNYSEQGMQGETYVSLDVGESFLREWKKIFSK